MDSGTLFAITVISFIIYCAILSAIIAGATKTNIKMKHTEAQTLLLIEIALKQGVDPAQINKIIASLETKK